VVHGRPGQPVVSAWRLAFGTLTVLPVRPPTAVDRRTAGSAMVLAPVVGLVLGVPAGLLAELLAELLGRGGLLPAVAVVALLAALTRGMHLDGLADVADGLGSGKPSTEALEVMRRSDIGPFGVVTLLLVLLLQVAALERVLAVQTGVVALVGAVVLSRLVLPLLCSRGRPAARPEGLGATVAGTVSRAALAGSCGLAALGLLAGAGLFLLLDPSHRFGPTAAGTVAHGVLAIVVPLLLAVLFARHCDRRFGGVTGDVLGACVELTFTAALVVAAA
jgi:adenosylcobinamide-GDP ribazoletransferase